MWILSAYLILFFFGRDLPKFQMKRLSNRWAVFSFWLSSFVELEFHKIIIPSSFVPLSRFPNQEIQRLEDEHRESPLASSGIWKERNQEELDSRIDYRFKKKNRRRKQKCWNCLRFYKSISLTIFFFLLLLLLPAFPECKWKQWRKACARCRNPVWRPSRAGLLLKSNFG